MRRKAQEDFLIYGIWAAVIFFAAFALAMVIIASSAGCGNDESEENLEKPLDRREAMEKANSGKYKVVVYEAGLPRMTAIRYEDSMRLIPWARNYMFILNERGEQKGRDFRYEFYDNSYKELDIEEAEPLLALLPSVYVEPYIEIEELWKDDEMEMETQSGSTVVVHMKGPEGMPSYYAIRKGQTATYEIEWKYYDVGEVSIKNAILPDVPEEDKEQRDQPE